MKNLRNNKFISKDFYLEKFDNRFYQYMNFEHNLFNEKFKKNNIYEKDFNTWRCWFYWIKNSLCSKNLGFKTLIIDNLSTGRIQNIDKSLDFIKADIGNFKKMNEVFKKFKPDYIYNFAFNVLVPKSIENPSLEIKSIRDHLNILEMCKVYNTKKLFFLQQDLFMEMLTVLKKSKKMI